MKSKVQDPKPQVGGRDNVSPRPSALAAEPWTSDAPTLVVLAAGMGSRYGGLKQIEAVGPSGEIVIDYSLFDAIAAGFGRAVFVIRRDIEDAFRSIVEPHFVGRLPIEYVFQSLEDLPAGFPRIGNRAKPWGTAHAVYACRHAVREPFAVINADDFYGRESFQLLAGRLRQFHRSENRYCLVAFVLRNTLSEFGPVSRGVCSAGGDDLLAGIAEHYQVRKSADAVTCLFGGHPKSLSGEEFVSMNLWGFTPTFFEHLEREFKAFLPAGLQDPKSEFQLPAVVDMLIRSGIAKVDMLTTREKWMGVTYPDDRPAVASGIRALVRSGVYGEKLWL